MPVIFPSLHGIGERPPGGLADRGFLLLLAASLGAFSNYAPMLSVVPLWSADGGSGPAGVGAATGVTMAATVAAQVCMPWLLRRFSLRALFALGATLLGAPTLAYVASSDLGWVLGVSAVRGAGFGMVAVAGSALAAELVTVEKRGRALGWYGVAVGLPQVVCLPLAVWSLEVVGFAPVFVASAVLCLVAVPLVVAIPPHASEEHDEEAAVAGRSFRQRWLWLTSPWLVLVTSACALGGVTSFLPLALEGGTTAATGLFVLSAAAIVGRWAAGWLADRLGAGRLLLGSVAASALGMGGFAAAVSGSPATLLVTTLAAVTYGAGFGVLQNDTLVVMLERSGPGGSGTASTAWNMAFDAGTGAGAVLVGVAAVAVTVGGAFLLTAGLIAAALPFAWLSSRAVASRA